MMNKTFLVVSIVLNAFLLMHVFGIIPFLLYVSALLNIILVWYIINNFKEMNSFENDVDSMMNSMSAFSDHIEDVHGLEMYYGDQTLKDLIDHSRLVVNNFVDFQEKYYDAEVGEASIEEEEIYEEAPSATDEE